MEAAIKLSDAPFTREEFNKMYNSWVHWIWADTRIPKELKELVETQNPKSSLELGCGLGRFSSYMAQQGVNATGIDVSSAAVENAKRRVTYDEYKPAFLVGDATNLDNIYQTFDVSFDVGCFHSLDLEEQKKYAAEVYRILKPEGVHLIWALNHSPDNIKITQEHIEKIFGDNFQLVKSTFSRRRIIASRWYWLKPKK